MNDLVENIYEKKITSNVSIEICNTISSRTLIILFGKSVEIILDQTNDINNFVYEFDKEGYYIVYAGKKDGSADLIPIKTLLIQGQICNQILKFNISFIKHGHYLNMDCYSTYESEKFCKDLDNEKIEYQKDLIFTDYKLPDYFIIFKFENRYQFIITTLFNYFKELFRITYDYNRAIDLYFEYSYEFNKIIEFSNSEEDRNCKIINTLNKLDDEVKDLIQSHYQEEKELEMYLTDESEKREDYEKQELYKMAYDGLREFYENESGIDEGDL